MASCGDFGGLKANGLPCTVGVRPGFTRCYFHGGTQPVARMKAEQALALGRMPAIEALNLIVEQFTHNVCTSCGYPRGDAEEKRVMIAACRTILDRTGMPAKAVVELTKQNDGDVDLQLLNETERGELLGYLAGIRNIKETLRARARGEEPPSSPTIM